MVNEPVAQRRRRMLRWMLAAAVLALVAAASGWLLTKRMASTPPQPELVRATLALLPLHPGGESEEDKALAEGLTDELTDALARLPGLRVIGTTSARVVAEKTADAAGAGKELGADSVLEGSLRRDGAQLHLSLQLLRTANGSTRWKQDYARGLGDFPAIQRDIVQAVASALALPPLRVSDAPASVDAGHFRRYLEARNLLREGPSRAEDAVARFRALVAETPRDARAHEGLADALYDRGFGVYEDVRVLREEALVEARRALELDPGLADPQAVLADAPCRATQWEACLTQLQRAIDLAPTATHWRNLYAWRLATLGYLAQARDALQAALTVDPFDTRTHYMMATVLDALGDHAGALAHVERQTAGGQNITRWFNAVWRHDFAAAGQMAETYAQERWRPCMIAVTAAMQDPAQWPAARAAVEASMRPDGRWTFYAMLLPDPDVASNMLGFENTVRSGNSAVTNYLWAPELANHRRGAEFQSYLRRNHMLDYWREHGWPDRCKPDGDGARCE